MKRKKRRRTGRMRIFIFLGITLLALVGVMIFKTLTFSSKQQKVAPVEAIAIDTGAVGRLSKALSIKTVSTDEKIDTLGFRKLDTFIVRQYPLIDSLLQRITTVSPFSQFRLWKGADAGLRPIILMAHLDVVPVEESSKDQWAQPPFAGKVQDGYIWGRGAIDDKLSAFGLLEAVEMLLREQYQPKRSIYLAFGHDEEIGGKDGAMRMASYLKSQNIDIEYVLDEGQIVLEEAMPGLSKPLAMIGIAEKGYTTLTLEARLAEGGHSSMPPRETAIGVLSAAIKRLQDHPLPARIDGAVAAMFDHVGPEMPLLMKTLLANRWLTTPLLIRQMSAEPTTNAMMRTTTAPTIISGGVKDNVLPSLATAQINFRILPGDTPESVENLVREIINDTRVQVKRQEAGLAEAPSAVSATNSFGYKTIEQSIREIFPDACVAPALVIGATDSRHYKQVSTNIYRFLPVQLTRADLAGFHGKNERISIENYERAIRFYKQLIINSDRG